MERETGVMYEVKVKAIHDISGLFSQGDITHRPCPAITVGKNGLNAAHYQIEYFTTDIPPRTTHERK